MNGQMVPGEAGINEEQVAESAPLVRAMVVQRLEMIWRACEPHILPPDDDLGPRKPDPRFVEAGIRVTDRLINLYGLLKSSQGPADAEEVAGDAQVLAAQQKLAELEAKIKGDQA
jgi:hypothetical protein